MKKKVIYGLLIAFFIICSFKLVSILKNKEYYTKLLDEKTKEVVYLRITGNLSFNEIGEVLVKTPNWARVTFYRAKQKLKEVRKDEKRN